MNIPEIQNLAKKLVEKTNVKVKSLIVDDTFGTRIALEVEEPHFFIERSGEGLQALNHLVHRIIENKNPRNEESGEESELNILIDINDFQKRHIESVQAIAHMMSERARYFKSNIEVDPMSAFDRRIVHEFLSNEHDLKTESVGTGRSRRVVIKYVGSI